MPESYPALTVRNPWAWAIAHAGKSVENRTWEMTHKGPLWLHAGCRSRWDPAGADSPLVQEAWLRETGIPDVLHGTARDIGLHRNSDRIPFGAITALLEVTGCHFWDECGQGQKANGRWSWTMCSPWAVRGQ